MNKSVSINKRRGEVLGEIDGNQYCLCLTLGALAELENRLNLSNLSQLCDRFSTAGFSARDLIAILAAGMRGGGHVVRDEEVADMHIEGGLSGFAALVGQLLNATFSPLAHEDDGEPRADETTGGGQTLNPPKPQGAPLSHGKQ